MVIIKIHHKLLLEIILPVKNLNILPLFTNHRTEPNNYTWNWYGGPKRRSEINLIPNYSGLN